MKQRVFCALLALAVMAGFGRSAWAQGGGGATSLSGTITDASAAIIPGAEVTVKNNGTGISFNATSNEQGIFTIPVLDPGSYTVTVTLMGFKTAVLNDVRINAATPATVRVTMELGGVQETVVVAAGSEVIQTQSAAVTATIDTNEILKLPTGSRNALNFITTLAGVNTPAGTRDSTVNGLPQSAINITIDGVSAQDNWLKTTDGFFARVSPRLDAMEQVTVAMAGQDAAQTGQGAVQVRFVTRSGTNEFRGGGYYYLRHYKLNSNTWFNNRDLPPDPATGKAPKNEDKTFQPGFRLGGPIVRNKAHFFFNYEEERTPGQNSETRTVLHPRAEQGWMRYTVNGQTREVNVLAVAAANNHLSTLDPTLGKLFGDIRNAVTSAGTGLVDATDPLTQTFTYQYDSEGLTRYPTGRLDYQISRNHVLSGSFNFTRLLSTPDTTNNREPNFPGFPGTGNQHSDRYTVQGTLRSTLSANMVNELKIGRSGGATQFSPEIGVNQFQGTSVADQGGYFLDINGDFLGITNAHSTSAYSGREAGTRIVENTLNWIKGAHSMQLGFAFTQADAYVDNQTYVPTVVFGVASTDPANAMFNTTNFPNASNAQLDDARELYATLVGRVIGMTGELRLDNDGQYQYLGRGRQRAQMREWSGFVADTWRWKPNFTVNYGLRYTFQEPFRALNDSYSFATLADVCGPSGMTNGTCNLFQAGVQPGQRGVFQNLGKGVNAYKTDKNNVAPSLGVAWTIGGGPLGAIVGRENGDSVLRAGYSLGYDRVDMSTFATQIDDNPGIAQSANRNHSLNNLGTPGSILLRNRGDLGPPAFSSTRVYPMTDVITGDILAFHENLQTPYSQTWTAGWQRKLTGTTAFEIRYVGTRSDQPWLTINHNEPNIVENGFLDEFRRAQANLRANIAAGRGNTFAYTGAAGTSPLPIFLAYFNGANASQAGNTSAYAGTSWSSGTFLAFLADRNPNPFGMITNTTNTTGTGLINDAQRRTNALNAGLPANFFLANPDYLGGADLVTNGGYTRYNGLQLELRRRLSNGLSLNSNYTFGKSDIAERYSFRTPYRTVPQTGTVGGVTHSFKANWTYELPFGHGRKFLNGTSGWMNKLVGGWSLDGIARIQSGRMLDFGNVRLVGMTKEELQDSFKLRFDNERRLVFMLPQDIIDNTILAYSVSPTTATGYAGASPSGRYFAPANGPDCIEIAQTGAADGYGDCGLNNIVVTGPKLVRFDLTAVKRVDIVGRVNFEFRAEMLNAFNSPWFTPVTGIGSNANNYRVTAADSGRTVQLVWRVNF